MKKGKQRKKRSTSNKGYLYLRELDNVRYVKRPVYRRFAKFIKRRILPFVKFNGYKIKEKRKIAIRCVDLLYKAGPNMAVSDSRDLSKDYLRIKVWDALETAGFCNKCSGIQGIKKELKAFLTRYQGTKKLFNITQKYKEKHTKHNLARNSKRKKPTKNALIVVKGPKIKDPITGKKTRDLIPFSALPPEVLSHLKNEEIQIDIIIRAFLLHECRGNRIHNGKRIDNIPLNGCFKRIHSGEFRHYARLYTYTFHNSFSAQSLREDERRTITIDGEKTVELDYSAYQLRGLYNLESIDPGKGDLYKPEIVFPSFYRSKEADESNRKVVRSFVKEATMRCWNTPSKRRARQAIGSLLHNQKVKDKKLLYNIFKTEGWQSSPVRKLVRRITKTHSKIKHRFFNKNTGAFMQTRDGDVMLDILWEFIKAGKTPPLHFHDGIVCKLSDEDFAHQKMIEVYQRYYGFKPQIKKV